MNAGALLTCSPTVLIGGLLRSAVYAHTMEELKTEVAEIPESLVKITKERMIEKLRASGMTTDADKVQTTIDQVKAFTTMSCQVPSE